MKSKMMSAIMLITIFIAAASFTFFKRQNPGAARSLTSSGNNAPWPLTITVTSLVVIVWGIIFYILYQLILIKKEGKYKIEISSK